MATSTNEITPNFIKWFAEKSVREYIEAEHTTSNVRAYPLMLPSGDILVTTNYDERQFVIVRDTTNNQIRMTVGNKTIIL